MHNVTLTQIIQTIRNLCEQKSIEQYTSISIANGISILLDTSTKPTFVPEDWAETRASEDTWPNSSQIPDSLPEHSDTFLRQWALCWHIEERRCVHDPELATISRLHPKSPFEKYQTSVLWWQQDNWTKEGRYVKKGVYGLVLQCCQVCFDCHYEPHSDIRKCYPSSQLR